LQSQTIYLFDDLIHGSDSRRHDVGSLIGRGSRIDGRSRLSRLTAYPSTMGPRRLRSRPLGDRRVCSRHGLRSDSFRWTRDARRGGPADARPRPGPPSRHPRERFDDPGRAVDDNVFGPKTLGQGLCHERRGFIREFLRRALIKILVPVGSAIEDRPPCSICPRSGLGSGRFDPGVCRRSRK